MIKKIISKPKYYLILLLGRVFPDTIFFNKIYLKIMYKYKLKKKLNINNPQTFNEKLQWLKIYDRNPIYPKLVDKYEAKKYVKSKIGEEIIIPTIGVYNNFEEIDFSKLPEKFIIKCTHDSGGVIICNDKKTFDIEKARKKIKRLLKRNYFYSGREWPYKNIKPRIIIEDYMGDNLIDYKFQCFNGKMDNVLVCEGRYSKKGIRYYFFDKDWNYLDYCPYPDVNPQNFTLPKPDRYEEMIKIAEELGKDLKQVRVDLYNINGKIYFGELTFFPQSGFDDEITIESDKILGERMKI